MITVGTCLGYLALHQYCLPGTGGVGDPFGLASCVLKTHQGTCTQHAASDVLPSCAIRRAFETPHTHMSMQTGDNVAAATVAPCAVALRLVHAATSTKQRGAIGHQQVDDGGTCEAHQQVQHAPTCPCDHMHLGMLWPRPQQRQAPYTTRHTCTILHR